MDKSLKLVRHAMQLSSVLRLRLNDDLTTGQPLLPTSWPTHSIPRHCSLLRPLMLTRQQVMLTTGDAYYRRHMHFVWSKQTTNQFFEILPHRSCHRRDAPAPKWVRCDNSMRVDTLAFCTRTYLPAPFPDWFNDRHAMHTVSSYFIINTPNIHPFLELSFPSQEFFTKSSLQSFLFTHTFVFV